MIWIFHFIVVTLLLLITVKKKEEDFFIKTSFVYSLFIFGQRWMTGTDFPNYLRYYLTDFQVREPIYKYIQVFLSANNLYFGILVFIIFSITIFNNYRFIIKIDRNIVLMLYAYLLSEVFFAQLSQMRQFIAISFFINAYFNAYEKKYGYSLLNILLGAGFHTSILFVVPFILIQINISRIKAIYLMLVSAILPILDVTLLLKLPFFSRYAHYIESRFNVNLSIFHTIKFYVLLIVIFLCMWNLKKIRKKTIDQMILNGILLNMLIYGLSFQFAPMIRVSSYFKIFELVFLLYYLKEINNYSKIVVKFSIIGLFSLIYAGFALTDPYLITRYEFRYLRIYDDRETEQLQSEINNFYN